jgi:hypothetical protein
LAARRSAASVSSVAMRPRLFGEEIVLFGQSGAHVHRF